MIPTRWMVLAGMLFLGHPAVALVAEPTGEAEVPSCFQPRGTWWETMLASREALVQQEVAAERRFEAERRADPALKTFEPLRMELTSRRMEPDRRPEPRKIKVRVAGLKQLYIGCAGQFEVFLAGPQLIADDGEAVPLRVAGQRVTDRGGWFRHVEARSGWHPITWEQHKCDAGFSMREAEVCLELEGRAEWLEGWVGVQPQREVRQMEFWVEWRSLAEARSNAIAARRSLALAVAEAFPSPVDARQQRLEASTGIWKADWKPGDLADLAARYAGACGPEQKQAAEETANRCKSVAELKSVRDLFYTYYIEPRLALARKTLEMVERAAPRPQLAAELAALQKEFADSRMLGAGLPTSPQNAAVGRPQHSAVGPRHNMGGESLYIRACNLRRKIVLSHPALDFPKLLINKRSWFLAQHMCDQYLGRFSREAPGLVVLEDWKESPRETVRLADKLPPGGTIHPDLSYDGRRVLFAFADHSSERTGDLRAYYIYEYSFETGEVRQITGTATDPMEGRKGRQTVLIEDIDPCYLPDGGVAFISTRSQ